MGPSRQRKARSFSAAERASSQARRFDRGQRHLPSTPGSSSLSKCRDGRPATTTGRPLRSIPVRRGTHAALSFKGLSTRAGATCGAHHAAEWQCGWARTVLSQCMPRLDGLAVLPARPPRGGVLFGRALTVKGHYVPHSSEESVITSSGRLLKLSGRVDQGSWN
jgi:hypothetical protein